MQIGLSIADLDRLETGEITSMVIESNNDSANYSQIATQADYDRF